MHAGFKTAKQCKSDNRENHTKPWNHNKLLKQRREMRKLRRCNFSLHKVQMWKMQYLSWGKGPAINVHSVCHVQNINRPPLNLDIQSFSFSSRELKARAQTLCITRKLSPSAKMSDNREREKRKMKHKHQGRKAFLKSLFSRGTYPASHFEKPRLILKQTLASKYLSRSARSISSPFVLAWDDFRKSIPMSLVVATLSRMRDLPSHYPDSSCSSTGRWSDWTTQSSAHFIMCLVSSLLWQVFL